MPHRLPDPLLVWLADAAVPLGQLLGDRSLLARLLAKVRIFAVADCTHGTHEFFTARFALLRHLVEEHGLRCLAIEASRSGCAAIDRILVTGKGDPRRALSGLGLLMWDIEEMVEIIRWMRSHNRRSAEADMIRLHGLDFWGTRADRRRCAAFIAADAAVKRERLPILRALTDIGRAEASGMMRAHRHVSAATLQAMRDLAPLARHAPANAEGDAVRGSAAVLLALVTALRTGDRTVDVPADVPRTALLNNLLRSRFMAEELTALANHAGGSGRVLAWTHVYHAMKGFPDAGHGRQVNMGAALAARHGQAYYVLAEETGEGTYLTRTLMADRSPGALVIGTIASPSEHSLPGRLAQAGTAPFLVDLRQCKPHAVADILACPVEAHAIGWLYMDPAAHSLPIAAAEAYDGLLFAGTTTPTVPTPAARRLAGTSRGY